MYDELVKELRHIDEFATETNRPTSGIFREAADAIEELTALSRRQEVELVELTGELASKPRWIPVTERLPEDDSDVLCWYEYYHWSAEKVLPEYGIGQWCNGIWGGEVSNGRDCKVLSWMPLPEPPKEGEA